MNSPTTRSTSRCSVTMTLPVLPDGSSGRGGSENLHSLFSLPRPGQSPGRGGAEPCILNDGKEG